MLNRIYRAALACTLLLLLLSALAHADGGAPNLAYVAESDKGISVIDIKQQKVTSTITPTGNAHTVLLSLDGSFLYVTQPQQGRVAILKANDGSSVCNADVPGQPTLLAIDTSSNTLFAAGNGASSVSAIDPTNCAIKHTIQASDPVYGIAIAAVGSSLTSNTGNQLWVTAGNEVTTFDDVSGKVIGSVDIPGGARNITIPAGATVYITTQSGSVQAIDLTTRRVVPLVTGGQYGPMDYDAGTGEIYVPDQAHNQLVVLTPVNPGFAVPREPARTIKFAVKPTSVAITSDGQFGFVALASGNVVMLDIPGRQTITTIHVGGDPQFIITGLYPPPVPQDSPIGKIINIAAYVFVIALFIVPIILFRRYSKARTRSQ
jgi:hypothetical protein